MNNALRFSLTMIAACVLSACGAHSAAVVPQSGALAPSSSLRSQNESTPLRRLAVLSSRYSTIRVYTVNGAHFTHVMGAPQQGVRNPTWATFDSALNLFVANSGNDTVTEYAPPYTSAPITTIHTPTAPLLLRVDQNDDVFVNDASDTLREYIPPYTSGAAATIQMPNAFYFIVNPRGYVVAADGNNSVLYRIDPPYDHISRTLHHVANNITVTPDGAIWTSTTNELDEYTFPYVGKAAVTIPDPGIPTSIQLTQNGALATLRYGQRGCVIDVFEPPYTNGPVTLGTTVQGGLALGLFQDSYAVDPNGPIYALDSSGANVYEWQPPYSDQPTLLLGNLPHTADAIFISPRDL